MNHYNSVTKKITNTQSTYYNGRLSINKEKNSPYWQVTFQAADGKMKRRSTKVPVAGGQFQGEILTAKQAERLAYTRGVQIACEHEQEYQSHNNITVREWFKQYLRTKYALVSDNTISNARVAYKHFYAFLGKRADEPLRHITKADLKAFILWRREQVRQGTVIKDLGSIVQAFRDAYDSEIIDRDPTLRLTVPPDRPHEKTMREPFTMAELTYIIDHFPPLWSSAVRCAFETFGQRLGDILRLDWSQFDWQNRLVHFTTAKTGHALSQPMRPDFYAWAYFQWQQAGCPDQGLLHEPLLVLGSGASTQFTQLLRAHNIGTQSKGPTGRRHRLCTKTFHSIRATVATLLHTNGTSQGIAMHLVGHKSGTVHAAYIKPNTEQLRQAALALPSLPTAGETTPT